VASPSLATMRGECQLLVQDTSTVGAGLSNANWTTLINLALRWFYDNTEKRVKSATIVTSYAAGVTSQSTDAGAIYPEIVGPITAVVHGQSSPVIVLDPMTWGEVAHRQSHDTTLAAPVTVARVKKSGAATNTWLIALYPMPDQTYDVSALVRDYPTALSGDSDVVELGDHEARIVVVIASIIAAPLLGRPDLVQTLNGMLPKMLQDKMQSFVTHDEIKTLEAARG
jgi:hypothetical protein